MATLPSASRQGSLRSRLGGLAQAADPAHLGEYFSTHPTAAIRMQAICHFLQKTGRAI